MKVKIVNDVLSTPLIFCWKPHFILEKSRRYLFELLNNHFMLTILHCCSDFSCKNIQLVMGVDVNNTYCNHCMF